jgi:SAM-dependent methyltransferase
MVLFYLVMGLGVVMILIFLNDTTGFSLLLIVLTLTLITAIVVVSSIVLPQFTGAPWVPTSLKFVRETLAMTDLQQGELLYDLGSGDGRLVIAAARDFGARATGIEIDPFRVLYSRLKIAQLGLRGKVRIMQKNFFNVDLKDADVAVTFLLQETSDRLQEKLERELKSDSTVVSLVFQFKGWDEITTDKERRIHVYRPRSFLRMSS